MSLVCDEVHTGDWGRLAPLGALWVSVQRKVALRCHGCGGSERSLDAERRNLALLTAACLKLLVNEMQRGQQIHIVIKARRCGCAAVMCKGCLYTGGVVESCPASTVPWSSQGPE